MVSMIFFHASGTFYFSRKCSKIYLTYFPQIWVKYTESESDIQNNSLLYKIDKQCQNTFDFLEQFEKTIVKIQKVRIFILYFV